MIGLVIACCIVFVIVAIVAFVIVNKSKRKDKDKKMAPTPQPSGNQPVNLNTLAPAPPDRPLTITNLDKSLNVYTPSDTDTAVHMCYENQNSSKLIRMKPDMDKFDQFVKNMNASKNMSFMNVGPIYFMDSLGRKRSGAYELRMKINVYEPWNPVQTLPLIPKSFTGSTYKINLFDYLSIMLYPIGNEDCEYDMSRHFGGENRLQKNLLKFYVRHISRSSGYKRYYDDWSYWKQYFTIVDDVDYSSMFQVKDATGTFVDFPSGNQDIFYKGIQIPADGTLEIRKTNVPSSMKTMIFIVRTTYAGYGQSNIPFVHNSGPPGQYPTSLDSIVQLTL